MLRLELHNSTDLSDETLSALCREGAAPWPIGHIELRTRYSRGADFSGRCFYTDGRILINLGRHLVYPYLMSTHLARARAVGRRWYKPVFTVELKDGYQVVLFVFMHELYHLLVHKARRNMKQKESMCDRFAARYLVDRFGVVVRDGRGCRVAREVWDFQDLDGFVATAPRRRTRPRVPPLAPRAPAGVHEGAEQLLLFPV